MRRVNHPKPTLRSVRLESLTSKDHENSHDFNTMFFSYQREQAARIIQRAERRRRLKLNKKISKSVKVTDDPLMHASLHNILEPDLSNQHDRDLYISIIRKIKSGRYERLDYRDPSMDYYLFKALREGKISLNNLLMAKQISDASRCFRHSSLKDALGNFHFHNQNGPLQITKISYATRKTQNYFLKELDEHDKRYWTIDFTKEMEYLFFQILLEKLVTGEYVPSIFYKNIEKYVSQLAFFYSGYGLVDWQKESLQNLKGDQQAKKEAAEKLLRFIENVYSQMQAGENYDRADESSIKFLIAILQLEEQIPGVVTSPHYDERTVNTSVLSFVLMTQNAMIALQKSLHGNDTVYPFPTVGLITTRMIRALDNHFSDDSLPELKTLYGAIAELESKRPVELTYPGVPYNQHPHEYLCHPFLLTWHDLFHAWRSGANFKEITRHLRDILTDKGVCQTRKLVMSPQLWELTDMDISFGLKLRFLESQYKKTTDRALRSEIRKTAIKDLALFILSQMVDCNISHKQSVLFYFILINFVRDADKWTRMISKLPLNLKWSDFIESILSEEKILHSEDKQDLKESFSKAFLDTAMMTLIERNQSLPVELIILQCKLKDTPMHQAVFFMVEQIGIEKFFYWDSKSSLQIHQDLRSVLRHYCGLNEFDLDKIDLKIMLQVLLVCIKILGTNKQFQHAVNAICNYQFIQTLRENGCDKIMDLISNRHASRTFMLQQPHRLPPGSMLSEPHAKVPKTNIRI